MGSAASCYRRRAIDGDAVHAPTVSVQTSAAAALPRTVPVQSRAAALPPLPTRKWKRSMTVRTGKVIPPRTPRTSSGAASIDHTPQGAEREQYQYYCPLCMLYFRDILETQCCSQYTCYSCTLAFLKGKSGLRDNLLSIPVELPGTVTCMHCNVEGLQVAYTKPGAKVKSYSDSPETSKLLEARWEKLGHEESAAGDTFAELQRKMLSFEDEDSLLLHQDNGDDASTEASSTPEQSRNASPNPAEDERAPSPPNPAEDPENDEQCKGEQRAVDIHGLSALAPPRFEPIGGHAVMAS